MIGLSELGKSYGARTLFEGVSMKLNAGSRYGLVGANGSGKTTLVEIIAGDETLAMFSADSIGDDDIHTACVAAVAAADFAEERGSVLFKAAIAAIRSVWRAPDWGERRREMEREE